MRVSFCYLKYSAIWASKAFSAPGSGAHPQTRVSKITPRQLSICGAMCYAVRVRLLERRVLAVRDKLHA